MSVPGIPPRGFREHARNAFDGGSRRSAARGILTLFVGLIASLTLSASAHAAAPVVTIGYPVAIFNDSAVFSGLTGGAAGDSSLITVRVYPGSGVGGSPLMSITTPRMSGNWYTVQ